MDRERWSTASLEQNNNSSIYYHVAIGWPSTGVVSRSHNGTPVAALVKGDQRLWTTTDISMLIHDVRPR